MNLEICIISNRIFIFPHVKLEFDVRKDEDSIEDYSSIKRTKSRTVSPSLIDAIAAGFPQLSPKFASEGITFRSSSEYPNASAIF
jgi:hypothetical protein